VVKAMFAFEKDYEKDTHKADLEHALKYALNVPTPPEGYEWNLDNGGIRFQGAMTYRLWHNKFGYMPMSE
jgi:hypothetical protein